MFARLIFWTIFIITLGVLAYQIYQEIPGSPIKLSTTQEEVKAKEIIDYGDTPVFSKNLRFANTEITYHVDENCPEDRRERLQRALNVFEATFRPIKFFKADKATADIKVKCVEGRPTHGENLYTAGEGGPSRIISTDNFNLIKEGKISLYEKDSNCDYPVVELHELLHVFGFDHSKNPDSIMYNVSSCNQRITPDMVRIIKDLYSFEALPDLVLKNISAVQRGRYLDFNLTIINEGLKDSPPFELGIFVLGNKIESFNFESTGVGFGRTIRASNIRLPRKSINAIKFFADPENKIKEFNEANNIVQLRPSV